MKKVLVYPCGTEIGLEIYRATQYSAHYELIGGSSNYDHGSFVYKKHIRDLPYISDHSDEIEIRKFCTAISEYNIDMIYPAMDGVLTVFSKYRKYFSQSIIAPDYETTKITRSKRETYNKFRGLIPVPRIYTSKEQITTMPLFVKPDVGQGSAGTKKVLFMDDLTTVDFDKDICMEFLPGSEYTIDCFTNQDGKLIYAKGRGRRRIKNGISVNSIFEDRKEFYQYAQIINSELNQFGGWFFQIKEDNRGNLKLLEVASRIAGTSAISRCHGANLPLMTIDIFNGVHIDDIVENNYVIELDRALRNDYMIDIKYHTVYIDYDDTIVKDGKVNTKMIAFLFQCRNKGVKIVLISKHDGDLIKELEKYAIDRIFDKVYHLNRKESKLNAVKDIQSIFIDDSYGERKSIYEKYGIAVFDTHMIECLMEDF